MAEEILNDLQQKEQDNNIYIDKLNEMQKNYVPKEELEKAQAENKKMLDLMMSGKDLLTDEPKPARAIEEILKDFTDPNVSNLKYVETALELHEARLKQGINDFVPNGNQINPTEEDLASANQVEEFLKDLVATADGSEAVFNNEYQRRVVNNIPVRTFNRK